MISLKAVICLKNKSTGRFFFRAVVLGKVTIQAINEMQAHRQTPAHTHEITIRLAQELTYRHTHEITIRLVQELTYRHTHEITIRLAQELIHTHKTHYLSAWELTHIPTHIPPPSHTHTHQHTPTYRHTKGQEDSSPVSRPVSLFQVETFEETEN